MSLPRLFWEGSVMEMGWSDQVSHLHGLTRGHTRGRQGVSGRAELTTQGEWPGRGWQGSGSQAPGKEHKALPGSCLIKAKISAPGGCR